VIFLVNTIPSCIHFSVFVELNREDVNIPHTQLNPLFSISDIELYTLSPQNGLSIIEQTNVMKLYSQMDIVGCTTSDF